MMLMATHILRWMKICVGGWKPTDYLNPDIKYFNCSNYKGNRGTCSSTHYIRVDFLEQVVLGEIRRPTKFATRHENSFIEAVRGHSEQTLILEYKQKERELKSLQNRDDELDSLFEKIYEDNVSGKLSDDRFAKMSRRYEDEQAELQTKIKTLSAELHKGKARTVSTETFINAVRKYTRVRKLTPRMLNELVEKIEVYHAERVDGVISQNLTIYYNCIGSIEIPEELCIEPPVVNIEARKGVEYTYTPSNIAI